MSKKVAFIDIGSNSTKYTIYEVEQNSVKTIYYQTFYNRLAEDVIANKLIKKEKIFELINILHTIKKGFEQHKVDDIVCIGTWALRTAQNSANIVKEIAELTGITITIIDEYHENLYSFYVCKFLKSISGVKAVINIGGGSVEISKGNEKLESSITLNLGGVVLKEKFFNDNTIPQWAQIKRCVDYVWDILKTTQIKTKVGSSVTLIGIGGTISTIYDILSALKIKVTEAENNLIKLSTDAFSIYFNKIKDMNADQIQKKFGIHQKRADIILPCSIVMKSIIDLLGVEFIYIAKLTFREGYIYYHYIKNAPTTTKS
jgi:exopolyphosphatase/guanosine-5'-triphosphate,3'-diphosphate pyrophosphatase